MTLLKQSSVMMQMKSMKIENSVDGKNPAPVGRQVIPIFTGFYTSQVVQDFFHQQYIYFHKI